MASRLPTVLLAAAVALPGFAPAQSFKTLVMIDASSSMRRTDPQKLRKVAAELYVDLARDGDQVAVWQFHRSSQEVSGFVRIGGPRDRDRLKDAVRAVGDDGQWTDFGAAFEAATRTLGGPPVAGEKRFLLFLTDGRCEPDPEDPLHLPAGEKADRSRKAADLREERCKQRVLTELLPGLAGVEPVVVGLSKGAPRAFLDEVARRGGGRAVVTERAEDLPGLFARVHAFNTGSRVVQLLGPELLVDALVESLDLIAVAPPGAELEVLRPGGERLPEDPGLHQVRAERYRFFRVPKPAAGSWQVRPGQRLAPGALVAIQNYDLNLKLTAPARVESGRPIELVVFLAAGEGQGLPDPAFLARHRFLVEARSGTGVRSVELAAAPDGSRVGRVATSEPGTVELRARVEPGPGGSLTRTASPVRVVVVPPLRLAFAAPIDLGEIKPGASARGTLDLSASEVLGEVVLQLASPGLPFAVSPAALKLTEKSRRFELDFALPKSASAGPVSGALALAPDSDPYRGRRGAEVPVTAVVVPLTFWEAHGTKTLVGSGALLLLVAFLGFRLPGRFPARLRLFYRDEPERDEGDYGLAARAAPGFFRSARLKVGGGGLIRRSSPPICEVVASGGSLEIRPARGRVLLDGETTHATTFRPALGTRYRTEDGLVLWVAGPEDDD